MAEGLPLYREIAANLRADLAAGLHPVGSRFPTEHELCRRFSVSRHTVRAAMRELEELGLLERRQGSGSTVIALSPGSAFTSSIGSLADLLQYARLTRLELWDGRPERLALEPHGVPEAALEGWTRLAGLRRTEDEPRPVCWTEIHLNPGLAEVAGEIGARPLPVYALIEERYGLAIDRVAQTLVATLVPPGLAEPLRARPDQPALSICRRYYDADGRLVEVAVSLHPSDRFTYHLDLRRDRQG